MMGVMWWWEWCRGDGDEGGVRMMVVWRGDRDEGDELMVGAVEMTWGNDDVGSEGQLLWKTVWKTVLSWRTVECKFNGKITVVILVRDRCPNGKGKVDMAK
ncbi:hypothetical protein Tco_0970920 [Tanacetum coccineum]